MPRPKALAPVKAAITATSRGYWSSYVQVGITAAGDPDRVHREVRMCERCRVTPNRECDCYRRQEDKVRKVEAAVAGGKPVDREAKNPGAVQAFTAYLALCQERVDADPPTMAYHTLRDYRMILTQRVMPRVRDIRIRQLDRDRIRDILREVQRSISSSAARKTLVAIRVALGWMMREGYVDRNEAELVDMPTLGEAKAKIEPLSEDEFAAVVPVIWNRTQRRARWLAALIHGQRQTELLGLALRRADKPRLPSDVDLKRGTMTIREKTERRFWEHGCEDPHACGQRLHRTRPCPQRWQHGCGQPAAACTGNRTDRCPARRKVDGCRDHRRICPPPCAPNCTKHAASCPQRRGGGIVRADTKTEASKHVIVLDELVVEAFQLDLADREAWRERAGSRWVDSGAVFVTELGREVDSRADWEDWQSILAEAGLPRTRVHDLRHTAVTNMFAAGMDGHAVKKLIGWSQDMSHVYDHVVEAVTRGMTAQLSASLRGRGLLPAPAQRGPAPVGPGSATEPQRDDLDNVIPFRRKAV